MEDYSLVGDQDYNKYVESLLYSGGSQESGAPETILPYNDWKIQQDSAQLKADYAADPIAFWSKYGYAAPDAQVARIINDYRGEPVAFLDANNNMIKWRSTYDTNSWNDINSLGEPVGYTARGFAGAMLPQIISSTGMPAEDLVPVSSNMGVQGVAMTEKQGWQFPWKTVIGTLSVPLTAALLPVAIPAFATATGMGQVAAGALLGGTVGASVGGITGGAKGALIGGIMGGIGGAMTGANLSPTEAAQAFPVEAQRTIEAMPLQDLQKINNVVTSGNFNLDALAPNDVWTAMAKVASQGEGLSDAGAALLMGSDTVSPSLLTATEMEALAPIKNGLTGSALNAYNYTFANTPAAGQDLLTQITSGLKSAFGDVTVKDIVQGGLGAAVIAGAGALGGGQGGVEVPPGMSQAELDAYVAGQPSAVGNYPTTTVPTGGAGGGNVSGAGTPLFPQFTMPTQGPFYGAGRFGEPGQYTNFYGGQATGTYGVPQYTPPASTFTPSPMPAVPGTTPAGTVTVPGTNININPDLINPPISNADMTYTPDASGQIYYERGSVSDLWNSLLNRNPTDAELAWANDAMAKGATNADLSQMIRQSTEYRGQELLANSTGGQATAPSTDWTYLLSSNNTPGLAINNVSAGMVSNILKGVLGNVNPPLGLVYDIFGRIPSKAADWADLVSNVQNAYNNSAYRADVESQIPSQNYYGQLGQQLQTNPNMTIGELQQFAGNYYGSPVTPTQDLTSIQYTPSDTAFGFIPEEVRQAYQTYLGRPIGAEGAQWVAGSMSQGGAINDIIAAIQSSPEAQSYLSAQNASPANTYIQTTPTNVNAAPVATAPAAIPSNIPTEVQQAYNTYLGRDIGQEGINYWGDVISRGGDINAIIQAIQSSPEAQARLA